MPKLASEDTVFYEKNLPRQFAIMPLLQIPAQMILRLQIKKPFVLVLVSEHSQVSDINVDVIRKCG